MKKKRKDKTMKRFLCAPAFALTASAGAAQALPQAYECIQAKSYSEPSGRFDSLESI